MINARHRFHGYGSLKAVYDRGQTVRSPHISLKYAERSGRKTYRVAVVVSRKVHRSAVVRNRIRRRVYEIVRQADQQLLIQRDLVFTVFSEQIADLEQPKLAATVESLLRKAADKPANTSQTPVKRGIVNKQHEGK
jgi:ribonuclease P protein component